jgi:hypothetical protein
VAKAFSASSRFLFGIFIEIPEVGRPMGPLVLLDANSTGVSD